jgi:hypothetical protein
MNTQAILIATLVFLLTSALLLLLLRPRQRPAPSTLDGGQPPRRNYAAVACAPIIVGVVLLCMLSCLIPITLISNSQIAFAKSAPLIQAVTPGLIGQEVLVEGSISPQNPLNSQGLVAFAYYRRHKSGYELESKWTPPLLVQLPGGVARIENHASPAGADYRLENVKGQQIDRLSRIGGLVRGDQVLVIGRVVSGPGGAYLDAADIFLGDRADYIAVRGRQRLPTPVIIGLAALACLACAYGAFPLFGRRWRR